MPYVNIKGFVTDTETGESLSRMYTRNVNTLLQAKVMALEEFDEEAPMWIFDDESDCVVMPTLCRWDGEQKQWENANINISRSPFAGETE